MSRPVRALAIALTLLAALPVAAHAQQQRLVSCPAQRDSLLEMPQVSSAGGRLRAKLKLVDGVRTLWGPDGDNRCATQRLRYLEGATWGTVPAWPTGPEPIPGPTFRARVGDLVEIGFFNQVNVANFAASLDHGAVGSSQACDQYTTRTASDSTTSGAAGNDSMPNCLHGSSTTNVHFHGTHTTPATTGDNVLLFIRPALRTNGALRPRDEARAMVEFARLFSRCEAVGPPQHWREMPAGWQDAQRELLREYDRTAPYLGVNGNLPDSSKLWPVNAGVIAAGGWPQYQVGANPYCFPLPAFDSTRMRMGQSPGTHWYHAHKHGSTALNVANGLTGALIIAGAYDDTLHAYYGPAFRERVLMLQQLGSAPFPLTNPYALANGPGSVGRARISVNGRLNPVVGMRPGEVQMWRIINGAFRDAVQFAYIEPQRTASCASTTPPPATVQWRQVAQDGVQFNVARYPDMGAPNRAFNLAPANRADLLVQAPSQPGLYTLCVVRNSALFVQDTGKANGAPDAPSALFTVSVGGAAVNPSPGFIPASRFPVQPSFLRDIATSEIRARRELVFGAGNSTIDGKMFADHTVNQAMLLNTAEEWTVKNMANDKSHPFHIHINPFQITAVFEPNAPAALAQGGPCFVDNLNPATWVPCASTQTPAPFVWWDTFAIPSARKYDVTANCVAGGGTPNVKSCPGPIQAYTTCRGTTKVTCTQTLPGWFRLRSRFVDFTGQYVLHCHILIHEDRGMMQLIEVVSDRTGYSHH